MKMFKAFFSLMLIAGSGSMLGLDLTVFPQNVQSNILNDGVSSKLEVEYPKKSLPKIYIAALVKVSPNEARKVILPFPSHHSWVDIIDESEILPDNLTTGLNIKYVIDGDDYEIVVRVEKNGDIVWRLIEEDEDSTDSTIGRISIKSMNGQSLVIFEGDFTNSSDSFLAPLALGTISEKFGLIAEGLLKRIDGKEHKVVTLP